PPSPSFPTRRSSDLVVMLDQEVDERLLRRVSALGRFENCPVRATGSPLGALRALDLVRLLRERSAGGLRKMRDRSLALRGRRRLDRKSTRLNSSHVA